MRSSIVLLELVVGVVLLSVLFVGSSNLAYKIYLLNETNYHQAIAKIDMESTKLFLEKQVSSGVDITTKLSQIPQTATATDLTYGGKILQKHITKFSVKKVSSRHHIDICTKHRLKICKSWVF